MTVIILSVPLSAGIYKPVVKNYDKVQDYALPVQNLIWQHYLHLFKCVIKNVADLDMLDKSRKS